MLQRDNLIYFDVKEFMLVKLKPTDLFSTADAYKQHVKDAIRNSPSQKQLNITSSLMDEYNIHDIQSERINAVQSQINTAINVHHINGVQHGGVQHGGVQHQPQPQHQHQHQNIDALTVSNIDPSPPKPPSAWFSDISAFVMISS
jgi:hypothetical protein